MQNITTIRLELMSLKYSEPFKFHLIAIYCSFRHTYYACWFFTTASTDDWFASDVFNRTENNNLIQILTRIRLVQTNGPLYFHSKWTEHSNQSMISWQCDQFLPVSATAG